MRRGGALVVVALFVGACGAEKEETVSAPASKPAADRAVRSAAYDECASQLAIGSSDDAELSPEMRRLLKEQLETLKAEDPQVLCAVQTDSIEEEGWTHYAPLAETAENAATVWVQAINARDWPGVCEQSVMPQNGCESVVERIFGQHAGNVKISGFYKSHDQATFALNAPDGVEPVVERHDGSYRVHFEYAIIE